MNALNDFRFGYKWFVLTALAVTALSIFFTFFRGPVLWWDWAHYHHYAGFQWLEGGLERGFMPAGSQSAFNPVGYVPAYWLSRLGLSALSIAILTAGVHALNVVAVGLVAGEVFFKRGQAAQLAVLLCMVYALLTPVFLDLLGTSSIDPLTSIGVVGGLGCFLRARRTVSWRWLAAGGVGVGMAAGLKLSNAVVVLCLPWLWLMPVHPISKDQQAAVAGGGWIRRAGRSTLIVVVAIMFGFALVHGAWSVQLYRQTGNPFFPFLGAIFPGTAHAVLHAQSGATAFEWNIFQHLGGGRFVPTTWVDWFRFPFDVANPDLQSYRVYLEWHSPDPRPALAVLIGLAGVVLGLYRVMRGRVASSGPCLVPFGEGLVFSVFMAMWGVAWVLTSGNGRYGLPWLMLLAVPVINAVWVVTQPGRLRRAVLWTILMVQTVYCVVVSEREQFRADLTWAQMPFQMELPNQLRAQPWLHLTVTGMSWSYLAPNLHPESEWASLFGACENCGGLYDTGRLRALLSRHEGRTRVLVAFDEIRLGRPQLSRGTVDAVGGALARHDLKLNEHDCVFLFPYLGFKWPGVDHWISDYQSDGNILKRTLGGLASCRVYPVLGLKDRFEQGRPRYDAVFAEIEQVCKTELGGAVASTQWDGRSRWWRSYPRRELDVTISHDWIELSAFYRPAQRWTSLAAWRNPATRPDCSAVLAMTRPAPRKPFAL